MSDISAFLISRASTPQRLQMLADTIVDARNTAGMEFDLTVYALTEEAEKVASSLGVPVVRHSENVGQHVVTNQAIEDADEAGSTHLLRLDDDVHFTTKGWLRKLMGASTLFGHTFIISPTVKGLNNPPPRSEMVEVHGIKVKFLTTAIGGICRLHHMEALRNPDNPYVSDVRLPLGSGDATGIAAWAIRNKYWMVYLDSVVVKHRKGTSGQVKEDPSYHASHGLFQVLPYIPAWSGV